jgi:hypothetical protein
MNIMSDLLETSNFHLVDENVDDMVSDLLRIKKALDRSIRKDIEHEFIYSMVKFARINTKSSINELIKLSLEDWSVNSNFES